MALGWGILGSRHLMIAARRVVSREIDLLNHP
jgi:hypothetical protein